MYSIIWLLLWVAPLLSLLLAVFAWRQRPSPGAYSLTFVSLAIGVWSGFYALEVFSGANLSLKVFWATAKYIGIALVPVVWLTLALEYTNRTRWVTRRNVTLLALVPCFSILLIFTNSFHHFVWGLESLVLFGPYYVLQVSFNTYFWVHTAYSYILILAGTLLVLHFLIHSIHLYRWQAWVILLGTVLPWISNAMTLSGLSPVGKLDLTPLVFTLTCLLYNLGIFGLRLLGAMPIAREIIVESISDGVLVLDARGRVADLNSAAERILERKAANVVGLTPAQLGPGPLDLLDHFAFETEASEEVQIGAQQTFKLQITPLYDWAHHLTGRLVIWRDITDSKRIEMLLRRQIDEQTALRAIAIAGSEAISIESLIEQTTRIICETLYPNDITNIGLIDELSGGLYYYPSYSPIYGAIEGGMVAPEQGIGGRVIATAQPANVPDVSSDPSFLPFAPNIRAEICVPLQTGDQVIGLINVESTRLAAFSESDARLLATMARQITTALEKVKMFAEVQRMAITDSLTGLYNRRYFFDVTQRELERSRRYNHTLSVIMLDVDNFKKVNDTYGHASGDVVLQALANSCHKALRTTDIASRYGGEEFVILLPETDLDEAKEIAERIRKTIAGLVVPTTQGLISVTISLGIASLNETGFDLEKMLDCADQAMYAAKRSGRNCTFAWARNESFLVS